MGQQGLSSTRILVVDDEQSMRETLEIMLCKEGYQVQCAASGGEALDAIRQQPFDLVITDIRMKPIGGLDVLKQCKAISPGTVVIIISAYASTELAVAAMNEGAYDYLPKPFKIDEIRTVIANALESRGVEEKYRPPEEGPLHYGCLIGEAPGMRKVYELIQRVAETNSNVLITGESGTGKELVAKAIHRQSARRDMPFIVVNCGGVPETLIESELFGYKKGSFTGAVASKKGLVEAAQGGTLFLDEIGELSPVLQVKLLRLVQEKTIKAIGDTHDVGVDVRIISATNRELERMVIEKTFREDLYYRLNVLPIRIPPLRERREDIQSISQYFLAKFTREFGKDIRRISSYAVDILYQYDFPGNVRELEHIIERGVALESSSIILPDSLTLSIYRKKEQEQDPLSNTLSGSIPTEAFDLDNRLAEIEKRILQQALQQTQGVKLKAAELLGISAPCATGFSNTALRARMS